MENYTLILTAPKLTIPSDNIIDFVKDLILSNLVNVDYFGYELDNQVDYEDDEMITKRLGTSYITFQFELNKIEYDDYTDDEIFELIVNQLQTKKIGEVLVDEKDIDIYLYAN